MSFDSGGSPRTPVLLRELRTRRVLGLSLLLGLAGAVIFGLLGEEVQDQEPIRVDSGASQFLHSFSSPPVDTAMQLALDALQLAGEEGASSGNPFERHVRDAKALQIYEGSNQVQRIVIAREMLR